MATEVRVVVTLPDNANAEEFLADVTTAATKRGGSVAQAKRTSYSPALEELGLVRALSMGMKSRGINTVDELFALTWQELVGPRFRGVVNFGRLLQIVRAGAKQNPPRVLAGVTVPATEQVEMMPWGTTSVTLYGVVKHHGIDSRQQLLKLDVVGLQKVAPGSSLGVIRVIRSDGHRPAPLGPDRIMADLDPHRTGFYIPWGLNDEDRIGDLTAASLRERLSRVVDVDRVEADLASILKIFADEWYTTIPD